MDLLLRRRAMMAQSTGGGGSDLPAGYIPYDYIGMTSRYALSLYPQEDMSIEFAFQVNETTNWVSVRPIQPWNNQFNSTNWGFIWYNAGITLVNGSDIAIKNGCPRDTKLEVKAILGETLSKLDVTINGTTRTQSGTPGSRPTFSSFPISLNAASHAMRLYRITIYSDTSFGIKFLDFIPCGDGNGNYGFWDTVSETFITNASWTAGND